MIFGETDAVEDLVDLLGGVCWAGHCGVEVRLHTGKRTPRLYDP